MVPPELVALLAGGTLLAGAMVWGWHTLTPSALIGAPPFFGYWRWSIRPTVLLPIGVAVAVIVGRRRAARLSWGRFLVLAMLAVLAWSAALALAGGGTRQLTAEYHSTVDYVAGVRAIAGHPGAYLRTYASRIRGRDGGGPSHGGYPIHVQGHPPGGVLSIWALTGLGLSAITASLVLTMAGQALAVAGVLLATRSVAGEPAARRVAPFVALLPAALWSHTLDTWFAGVAALAVAAMVVAIERAASGRPWRILATVGGAAFGLVCLLSYGLALLVLVPVALAWRRRAWRPLLPAAGAGLLVVATPLLWGFSLLAGLSATRHQYAVTVARHRPFGYFLVGDLVVVLVAIGPVVVAGLWSLSRRGAASRVGASVVSVVGAVALALVLADLSGMAKAEVERIWQPFYPWLAVAVLALPATRAREVVDLDGRRLALQAGTSIALAVAMWTLW